MIQYDHYVAIRNKYLREHYKTTTCNAWLQEYDNMFPDFKEQYIINVRRLIKTNSPLITEIIKTDYLYNEISPKD